MKLIFVLLLVFVRVFSGCYDNTGLFFMYCTLDWNCTIANGVCVNDTCVDKSRNECSGNCVYYAAPEICKDKNSNFNYCSEHYLEESDCSTDSNCSWVKITVNGQERSKCIPSNLFINESWTEHIYEGIYYISPSGSSNSKLETCGNVSVTCKSINDALVLTPSTITPISSTYIFVLDGTNNLNHVGDLDNLNRVLLLFGSYNGATIKCNSDSADDFFSTGVTCFCLSFMNLNLEVNLTGGGNFVRVSLKEIIPGVVILFNTSVRITGNKVGSLVVCEGGSLNLTFSVITTANNVRTNSSLVLYTSGDVTFRSCNVTNVTTSDGSVEVLLIGETVPESGSGRKHQLSNQARNFNLSITGSIFSNCTNILENAGDNGGLITYSGGSGGAFFVNNSAFRDIKHNSKGGVAYIIGNAQSVVLEKTQFKGVINQGGQNTGVIGIDTTDYNNVYVKESVFEACENDGAGGAINLGANANYIFIEDVGFKNNQGGDLHAPPGAFSLNTTSSVTNAVSTKENSFIVGNTAIQAGVEKVSEDNDAFKWERDTSDDEEIIADGGGLPSSDANDPERKKEKSSTLGLKVSSSLFVLVILLFIGYVC